MKAKEIAARILADKEEDACLGTVCDLINEAVVLAKSRRSDGSKLAVFRESFQKWQAVCVLLAGGTDGEKAGVSLYPKALQLTSKTLFVMCVHGGVFLSYELDDEDRAICSEVAGEQLAELREMEAKRRFNALFGFMMQRMMS
jgi:hypothetical protein